MTRLAEPGSVTPMGEVPQPSAAERAIAELARGLAARLRDAVAAADRIATFAFETAPAEPVPSQLADGEEAATAYDFVLRVLRAAGEPLNVRILARARAAGEEGERLAVVADGLGLTRMALIERANDLIQLGLLGRDVQADRLRISPAGAALLDTIAELEAEIAAWLGKRRRP